MILKENLYKILSFDSEERRFDLELVPDYLIYKAHFPELPITPGVCIIQIASELMKEMSYGEIELKTVSNAKFLAVINPLKTANVTYSFKKIVADEQEKTIKISVIVSNNDIVFAKLSLVYRRNDIF